MKRNKHLSASNKKIRNATKLEIDGHKFRSKLEAFTYSKLKENGINDFAYETIKFVLQPKFTFTGTSMESFEKKDRLTGMKTKGFDEAKNEIREITYLPDFVCVDAEKKTGWILEVKGFSTDVFVNKWKEFKHLLVKEGFNVSLYLPNNQMNVLKAIRDIKLKYYSNV